MNSQVSSIQRAVPLELIRALAAAMVFVSHLLSVQAVFSIAGKSVFFFAYGHEAVIAFFLLSGLVNRMALSRRDYGWGELLYLRGVRLLPTYFVVVIGSCLVQTAIEHQLPLNQLLGHTFFVATLQGEVVRTFRVNTPLWSMSFEVFFYLCLTICVATRSRKSFMIWGILALVAIATYQILNLTGFSALLGKMFGFSMVWLLGFSTQEIRRVVQFPVWTIAFIIGTIPTMTNLGLDRHAPVWFVAIGMMLWPMFIEVTRSPSEPPLHNSLAGGLLLLLIGTVVIGALWYSGQPMRRMLPLTVLPVLLAATSRFLVAGVGWVCNRFPDPILNCGRASYAVYLVHMPLFHVLQWQSETPAIIVALAFAGTAALVILLEWGLQPQVGRYFMDRRIRT